MNYSLEVRNYYGSSYSSTTTVTNGQVAHVDRSESPFGAGWWLAGLESLDVSNMVWTGGDGSTRQYVPAGANKWVAEKISRPDTLKLEGGQYVRHLRNGLKVYFTVGGRHDKTVNRLGEATEFVYDLSGRLAAVKLPSPGATRQYTFNYSSQHSPLQSVDAPLGRTVLIEYETSGNTRRVKKIKDPDGNYVEFRTKSGSRIIEERRDRRGTQTIYSFNNANKLTGVTIDPSGLNITTTFNPYETQGHASNSVAPDAAYTLIDGPRTDVADYTYIRHNRLGAPVLIRNTIGDSTVITYDGTWPALPASVTDPSGFKTTATYDNRGNLKTSTQINPYGTGNATSSYVWDPVWDFPQTITTPEGVSTHFTYDANGNRKTERVGTNTARTTTFNYTGGQLASITYPLGGVELFTYDPLGNLRSVRTPEGFLTYRYKDGLGRDTLVRTQVDVAATKWYEEYIDYDAMDRVLVTRSIGPEMPYVSPLHPLFDMAPLLPGWGVPSDTLTVTNEYDNEGNLKSLTRTASDLDVNKPQYYIYHWGGSTTTTWTYDRAGRKISEDGETIGYDEAGNVTTINTRRGHVIKLKYNELNQLVERIVPEVVYPKTCHTIGFPSCGQHFPIYPSNMAGELIIPADTQTFTYDKLGRQLTANNRYAKITRTYYAGSALSSEEQRIRSYNGADFDIHVYKLTYTYDKDGRRKSLTHPVELAGTLTPQTYEYDTPGTGELSRIVDIQGNHFEFKYDLLGRLDTLLSKSKSGSSQILRVLESRNYDLDGRITRRKGSIPATSTTIYDDTYTYDAQGRIKTVFAIGIGQPGNTTFHYSGRGHLVSSDWEHLNDNSIFIEEFRTDALGNVVWKRNHDGRIELPRNQWHIYSSPGILEEIVVDPAWFGAGPGLGTGPGPDTTYTMYDQAGNVSSHGIKRYITEHGGTSPIDQTASRSYYSADGKLRVFQKYGDTPNPHRAGTYDEYRYDALGRRIMLRSRTDSLCTSISCLSAIERFVWDGDQILYELRFPGGDPPPPGGGNEPPCDPEKQDCDGDIDPCDPWYPGCDDVDFTMNSLMSSDPLEYNTGTGHQWGTAGYTHGPGIDAPLALIRRGGSIGGTTVIVPHANWKGDYVGGTTLSGSSFGIDWPGKYRRVYLDEEELSRQRTSWAGSLVQGKRDLSGLVYMRNRYYDPSTGRFTQEDPIGLAGGLNLYGYAAGDPVNFSDPFGLCPKCGEGDDGVRPREGLVNRLGHGLFEPCSADNNADCIPSPLAGVVLGAVGGPAGGVSVYQAVSSGAVRYVGITKNFAARAAAHFRQRGLAIRAIDGLEDLSRVDARAVEQVLIEAHGLAKNGGTLLNRINSIAESNPAYANALKRGLELLQNVGYPIP